MSDEKIRYAYRTCPCFAYDVEGIQTWLEDMAAQGLVLEADGTFLGIFTFQKTAPRKCRYRLAPVKDKKGFFSDSSDGPGEEEQEFSEKCGWEYLVRYGSFYIYRATSSNARPLHTDPAVHAIALEGIKKQQRSLIISELIWLLIWIGLGRFSHPSLFMTAVISGPLHLFAILALVAWVTISMLVFLLRLGKYQKRLCTGDTLQQRKDWKHSAPVVYCIKGLPWVFALMLVIAWGVSLKAASESVKLPEFRKDIPFASISDVFPNADLDRTSNMGDYNTVVHYSTGLSENYEWNEQADIADASGNYYGILRLKYHDTAGEFWAKGLANDYYMNERFRYQGKRFEELVAPETAFDDVRICSSYGILHILIQHENTVTHATVSITQQGQNNQWQLWLAAMEDKLLH